MGAGPIMYDVKSQYGEKRNHLEVVKVISVSPMMHDTRTCPGTGHLESVDLRYEKITWKHNDGNIIFADSWNDRQTA